MDAAEARGRTMLDGPRAVSARYEPATDQIVVELANGCAYSSPAHLVQDLQGASQEDLAGVEVDGMGLNLHWPALDADLLVPALVFGIFGTRLNGAGAGARGRPGDLAGQGGSGAGERRQGRAATQGR